MALNTISRSLHDVGLAAWFGGTLANAVALNAAAGETSRLSDAGAVVNAGWAKWTPVNAAAIGANLIGSVGQLWGNKGRVSSQQGVATMSIVKTGLTAAALGVTGYSRILGKRVSENPEVPVQDGTTPSEQTPQHVASAQRQLKALQWAVPALTGALLVISAFAGEQQRTTSVVDGIVKRITG